MVHAQDNLVIKTQTTGFASPAESYVDKRLDLNELIVGNLHATFYFRYKGPKTLGVETNDILVIDRSVEPKEGDLVVLISCVSKSDHMKIKKICGVKYLGF